MVIVILGILAGFGLPKFVNFKSQAMEKSDLAVLAALNTAIKIKFTENIAQGSEPENAWPENNPFELLAQSPPYKIVGSFLSYTNDNDTWRACNFWIISYHMWLLCCPHWNGNYIGAGGSKGKRYMYRFGISPFAYSTTCPQQGDFNCYQNFGH